MKVRWVPATADDRTHCPTSTDDHQGPQFSASRGISSRASEFGRCRGISVFSRNCTEFCVNTEIPRQRPNSVRLYCCCNCDTQSLRAATQACWFQWRVFTFSLLIYSRFYLLDFCRWRWLVTETDWLAWSTDEWRHFFGLLLIFYIKV